MITKELMTVWIASDRERFFSKKDVEEHEQKINKEKTTWLKKLRQRVK